MGNTCFLSLSTRQLLLVTLTFLSALPAGLPFVTAWHPRTPEILNTRRRSLTMDGLELPMSTRLDLNLQRFPCSAPGVRRSYMCHNSKIDLFCNQDY
ncbi:hypothetical protein LEMLEM_LOCUS19823 [Lemmus lemmus]